LLVQCQFDDNTIVALILLSLEPYFGLCDPCKNPFVKATSRSANAYVIWMT